MRGFLKRVICIVLCCIMLHLSGFQILAVYADENIVEVSPVLSMPLISYEGHTEKIIDGSVYRKGNQSYTAKTAHEEGIVSGEFIPLQNEGISVGSGDIISERKVTFHGPGLYSFELRLTLSDGKVYTARDTTHVQSTPSIEASLAGAQKQNRKQIIDFRVASNPRYPVQDIDIQLENSETGEKAEAYSMSAGAVAGNINDTENIRIGSITCEKVSDGCYFEGRLEFLTEYDTEQTLSFTVNASDIRGQEDEFTQSFTVMPDKAPEADIEIEKSYIREAGSDTAVITVSDSTEYDGDQGERKWYVKLNEDAGFVPAEEIDGYMDMSMGSGSQIRFNKKGVGEFEVKLEVRDVWSEGTIDRFADPSEILSDETTEASEVINVAPYVTIGMNSGSSADVIVAGDTESDDGIKSDLNELKIKFLENGMDADISTSLIDGSRLSASTSDTLTALFTATGPFGYKGRSTSFESDLYVIDDTALYRVDSVWSDADAGGPEEPFTVSAYDAESGDIIWKYMFDSTSFEMDTTDAHLYQDDSQKYLYLVSGGNTLILSKKSGQVVSVVEHEFGQYSFEGQDCIFTFCSDGIYSADITDGKIEKIYSAVLSGKARRFEGRIITFTVDAKGNIMRILLDPRSHQVEKEYVGSISEESYLPAGYSLSGSLPAAEVVGIDVNGTAVISQNSAAVPASGSTSKTYYNAVSVYDSENSLLRSDSHFSSYPMKSIAVENMKGIINNYGVTYYSGNDSVTVKVVGIDDGYQKSLTLTNDNGRPCVYNNIIYAAEHDGVVKITLGDYHTWIYNDGWSNGPRHGYPERCITVEFDKNTGNAVQSASIITGGTIYSEYGQGSDMYLAIQTSGNSQYADSAAVETSVVKRSVSAGDMLLRHMKKYMRDDQSIRTRIMLIYADSFDRVFTDEEASEIKSYAESKGYVIYVVGNPEGTGASLSDSLDAVFVSESEDYVSRIAEDSALINQTDKETYVKVKPENEMTDGSMIRTFRLAEGEEYYFEMEFESDDPDGNEVTIKNNTETLLDDELYMDDSYYVTHIEKEDFGDEEYNDFFSYSNYSVNNGLFTDCSVSKTTSGNDYRGDTSVITFTVPEGEKGVLSFDFRLLNIRKYTNDNYIDIDGKRWQYFGAENSSLYKRGTYVHPEILTEGEHTITLGTSAYGAQFSIYTYIDNLKFSTISEKKPDTLIKDYSCINMGDGRYKLTGSFQTPSDISEFRAMKDIEYVSGAPGTALYTTYTSPNNNSKSLTLNIPENRKALLTRIKTASSVGGEYVVKYNWATGGITWECRGPATPYYNAVSQIPTNWIITMPPSEGKQSFTTSYQSYRGTSAQYTDIEMYIGDTDNSLINGNEFICGESSEGKTLFLGESRYHGNTELKIRFSNETDIYKFRLYMNNDGEKAYIADNAFADEEQLMKWRSDSAVSEYKVAAVDSNGGGDKIPVFEKGELIIYDVTYDDHEDDPSKASYWRYTHTPMNDGAHESAAVVTDMQGNILDESGIILDAPIERFYIDGRYTVEHWQTDDTTRGSEEGGNPDYDKDSNIAKYTFYVRGAGEAPWIKYIQTEPSSVYEGENCSVIIAVDDMMKDTLQLHTEILKDGERVFSDSVYDINPDTNGLYSPVKVLDCIKSAQCGTYTVVCTVSDEYGTGMDTYSFKVRAKGSVSGSVSHTEQWESNRRNYNIHYYGDSYDEYSDNDIYCDAFGSVPRGRNVFWAGEKMILNVISEGEPEKVTSWIDGYEDISLCTLQKYDKQHYSGVIWDKDMINIWKGAPEKVKIVFKAEYDNENYYIYEEEIIIDGSCSYWQLHKTE